MGPEQLRAYGQQPHCHQRFLRVVWDLRFPLQRVLNAPVELLDIERHLLPGFKDLGQKDTKAPARISRVSVSRLFHDHRDINSGEFWGAFRHSRQYGITSPRSQHSCAHSEAGTSTQSSAENSTHRCITFPSAW